MPASPQAILLARRSTGPRPLLSLRLLFSLHDVLEVVSIPDSFVKDKTLIEVVGLAGTRVVLIVKLADFTGQFSDFPTLQVVIVFVFEDSAVLLLKFPESCVYFKSSLKVRLPGR